MEKAPIVQVSSPIKGSALAKSVLDGTARSLRQSRPFPVFDEFRQIFMVTEGAETYYVDLDGNYDSSIDM